MILNYFLVAEYNGYRIKIRIQLIDKILSNIILKCASALFYATRWPGQNRIIIGIHLYSFFTYLFLYLLIKFTYLFFSPTYLTFSFNFYFTYLALLSLLSQFILYFLLCIHIWLLYYVPNLLVFMLQYLYSFSSTYLLHID